MARFGAAACLRAVGLACLREALVADFLNFPAFFAAFFAFADFFAFFAPLAPRGRGSRVALAKRARTESNWVRHLRRAAADNLPCNLRFNSRSSFLSLSRSAALSLGLTEAADVVARVPFLLVARRAPRDLLAFRDFADMVFFPTGLSRS
jgi:hypothetical protein